VSAVAAKAVESVLPEIGTFAGGERERAGLSDGERTGRGDAVSASKAGVGNADVRRSWIFFGDPATRLKGLPVAPATPPTLAATPAALNFAVMTAGGTTTTSPSQTVRLTQTGTGTDVTLTIDNDGTLIVDAIAVATGATGLAAATVDADANVFVGIEQNASGTTVDINRTNDGTLSIIASALATGATVQADANVVQAISSGIEIDDHGDHGRPEAADDERADVVREPVAGGEALRQRDVEEVQRQRA